MPVVCLLVLFSVSSSPVSAQCNDTPDDAVKCFVGDAVQSRMTSPRYGMTLAQFKKYGVSVYNILESSQTYLMLVGASSAIADAMPPTNADGSEDTAAQQSAITDIVNALTANGLATLPNGTTAADLQYFSMDTVNAMNNNAGYLQLMTPGVTLRIIDSYVVTATSHGTVAWSTVDSNLTTAIHNMVNSGLMKVPPNVTVSQMNSFVDSVAQTIWNYKQATGRAHL
jgi:hypothetical protein